MPKFKHKVETAYNPTFRTQKVAGMFDVPVEEKLSHEWDIDMPVEDEDWSVGLIVGPSGSGKTTIAKRVFGEDNYHTGFEWSRDKSILDDFPAGIPVKDITGALSHVGFSSPPAWMLPFHCLSNGQQFRAEMARLILESKDVAVVDEFTSVVDRTVAKASSAAVQKFVRKQGKRFVAVSCHYDIMDWLEPDWVYFVDTGEFRRRRLRRPPIELELRRVHHSAWGLFKGHHYLSADLNKSAHCFVAFMEGKPVGFVAALKFPHPTVKDYWKAHRTVVLPDYQGLGIGNAISEAVGEHFVEQGYRYRSVTSHPAMIHHRMASSKWVLVRAPGQVPTQGKNSKVTGQSIGRMTASFEYVGKRGEAQEK